MSEISIEEIDDLEIKYNIEYCNKILYKKFNFYHVENVCWITRGYKDYYYEYCYECAEKEVEKNTQITKSINRKLRKKGLDTIELPILDGGWGGANCGGQEGPVHCDECGIALDYSLSSSGIMVECEHFLEYGLEKINDEVAFELHSIFEDCCYNKYSVEDWVELGKLAKIILEALGEIISSNTEVIDLD